MKNSFNTKTEITCSGNKYTIFDVIARFLNLILPKLRTNKL